ncbi:hypothetical protein [Bosea sp. (in: a-proteobacteria)]|jgi:hypothetical protein|uniref:hypothetical protein n=1 Tax=Bosea sp. (in: a-proteobacteria) TaxID=1871050 RepID=UPI002DDCB718|nr:hypothetical protein [Bosea sp. (in: a-proteobacteria)]HEV2510343.1 hypothetical protein [Bosea sp. (in: a-proteobacteria)]
MVSKQKNDLPPSDLDLLRKILATSGTDLKLFSWQGDGFASVRMGSGREAFAIASRGFRAWLRQEFLTDHKRHPSPYALRTAINEIADQAADAPEERIWRRVGTDGDVWYIDLGNEQREVIQIIQGVWELVNRAPIHFARSRAMRPFPQTRTTGAVDGRTGELTAGDRAVHQQTLKAFAALLNLDTAADFQLLMTWCVCAMTPNGPYPVLTVCGEQGSAKSTLVRLIHDLVDPSHAPLRSLPSAEKDLFVSASNAHLLAFDNVSNISAATSDNLCKISTGGAVALRRIGTDTDEIFLEFKAPVILNGIGDLILRPDLADRALVINTTAIAAEERRDSDSIQRAFSDLAPRLTEALLDLLALARFKLLTEEAGLWKADRLPRMAEFAKLGIAIEDVFGEPGGFTAAYDRNRVAAADDLVESDPILLTILELWDEKKCWSGTMQDLQVEIAQRLKASGSRLPVPTGLAQISSHVKRIKPILVKKGMIVAFHRAASKDRRRTLELF